MTSFSAPRTTVTPQQLLSEQVRRILAAPVYDLAIETPLQAAPRGKRGVKRRQS